MRKTSVAPKSDTPALKLGDAQIEWGGNTYTHRDVAPVLRLGGAHALSYRLLGLRDLLDPHENLDENETAFLKSVINDLSLALFEGDDEETTSAVIVRRPKAVA